MPCILILFLINSVGSHKKADFFDIFTDILATVHIQNRHAAVFLYNSWRCKCYCCVVNWWWHDIDCCLQNKQISLRSLFCWCLFLTLCFSFRKLLAHFAPLWIFKYIFQMRKIKSGDNTFSTKNKNKLQYY